jgi:putative peptide maturation dehydrogenase
MLEGRRVRRCAGLFLEMREQQTLDLAALLGGGPAIGVRQQWFAMAPHLSAPVEVDGATIEALSSISETRWKPSGEVAAVVGPECLRRMVEIGVVVVEGSDEPRHVRELRAREMQWHPLSAVAHVSLRWSGVDSIATQNGSRIRTTADLVAESGLPPAHFHRREDAAERLPLERPEPGALDGLLERRTTCRNFDGHASLSRNELSVVLARTFGIHGAQEFLPGVVALKKNHPSGGGLHPLEAYLLLKGVQGVATGLYHYNVEAHALDLLRALPPAQAQALATTVVAGQEYFASAHSMIIVAARFARSFWKYRRHPKIYRAILLEAGHVSQNLYLTATELGLGAYVTAAINEVDIEQAFGLDPLIEGPIAVCGFGPRASTCTTIELDPAGRVWDRTSGRLKHPARQEEASAPPND